MMRHILLLFICCTPSLLTSGQVASTQALSGLKKDSIKSRLDGNTQLIYYYESSDKNPRPLIVQLHSWSYPVDSLKTMDLDVDATSKNFNYIFPNFRGVNNHLKACCSDDVISDIDEAIDWAIKNMKVDKTQI